MSPQDHRVTEQQWQGAIIDIAALRALILERPTAFPFVVRDRWLETLSEISQWSQMMLQKVREGSP